MILKGRSDCPDVVSVRRRWCRVTFERRSLLAFIHGTPFYNITPAVTESICMFLRSYFIHPCPTLLSPLCTSQVHQKRTLSLIPFLTYTFTNLLPPLLLSMIHNHHHLLTKYIHIYTYYIKYILYPFYFIPSSILRVPFLLPHTKSSIIIIIITIIIIIIMGQMF
jgi:hypothetical protein